MLDRVKHNLPVVTSVSHTTFVRNFKVQDPPHAETSCKLHQALIKECRTSHVVKKLHGLEVNTATYSKKKRGKFITSALVEDKW